MICLTRLIRAMACISHEGFMPRPLLTYCISLTSAQSRDWSITSKDQTTYVTESPRKSENAKPLGPMTVDRANLFVGQLYSS